MPGAARLPHRHVSLVLKPVKVLLLGLSGTHQLLQQILLQCFSVDSTHIVLKVKPLILQQGQKVGGFDSTASVTTQFFPNVLNLSRACCASGCAGDPKR